MGSNKRSARAKQRALFESQMGDALDDVFAREDLRRQRREEEHEAVLRDKACESKKRYPSRLDAQEAAAACAAHGRCGLHVYQCPYCAGWHLTSKPRRD